MTTSEVSSAPRVWRLWSRHRNFLLYALIGCSGVLLDLLVFVYLYNALGLHEQVATAISTTLGITNNFLLNYFFNFDKRDNILRRFVQFYIVGMLGIGLTVLLFSIFSTWLHVNPNIVKVGSLPVVLVFQYGLNKRWSFG